MLSSSGLPDLAGDLAPIPASPAGTPAVRRAAVLGRPIGHSLSPALHNAAYSALGLDWHYSALDVDAAGLPRTLDSLGADWAGLSLTMPLKRAVLSLLAACSPLVSAVGAANTVLPLPRATADLELLPERTGWYGDNTDVGGMLTVLRAAGVRPAQRVHLLGAGATTCSALAALAGLGVAAVAASVRAPERAGDLVAVAAHVGVELELAPWGLPAHADVLIATTPAGSTDDLVRELPSSVDALLVEVVYEPWPTSLASAWQARGGRVIGGFELLLQQAGLQVELMTGRTAPLAQMRVAGEAMLAGGARALR